MNHPPRTVGFFLAPGFTLAAVAAAVDVMALANYVSAHDWYRWQFISIDGQPVRAMNNVTTLADCKIADAPWLDSIAICCGVGGAEYQPSSALSAWLLDRYKRGAHVGSISTGAWCLARMRLLNERQFTVHWEDIEALQESFPSLQPRRDIFVVDGRLFSCSGGTAAVDMFLSFVANDHGSDLAQRVSEQLVHGNIRSHQETQQLSVGARIGSNNRVLVNAVHLMETHCEAPLSIRAMAERLQVTERHLERLFKEQLTTTPQLYYRAVRLSLARRLLRGTARSIREVALAAGFSNPSYFSRCYRNQFGYSPIRERSKD